MVGSSSWEHFEATGKKKFVINWKQLRISTRGRMEKKIKEEEKQVHPQNTRKKDRVWPLNLKMKLWRFGVARLGPAWWGVSFSLRFLLRVVLMCFLVMVTSSVVLEDREDTLRQPRSHTVRGRQHHTGSDSFRPRLFGQRSDVDRRSRKKTFCRRH